MKIIWLSFIIGLIGSLHCIGMCGPLISITGIFKNERSKIYNSFLRYHAGRIMMYAVLGAILGWLGHITEYLGMLKLLSIIMGLLIVGYAITSLFGKNISITFQIESPWVKIYNRILNSRLPFKTFTLGAINGILPCGLVYSAMVMSYMNNNIINGSISMILFGLGTLPALFLSVYGFKIFKLKKIGQLNNIQYYGLFISGVWLIYRAILLNADPNTSLWNSLINQKMCAH